MKVCVFCEREFEGEGFPCFQMRTGADGEIEWVSVPLCSNTACPAVLSYKDMGWLTPVASPSDSAEDVAARSVARLAAKRIEKAAQ